MKIDAEGFNDWDEVDSWHIVSYPRSGNHAVRAILEYVTERPTLPSLEARKLDIPIYLRKPNQLENFIKVTNDHPIGYKSHFLLEFLQNEEISKRNSGIILITRDPLEAIVSHLYPDYERAKSLHALKSFLFLSKKRTYLDDGLWSEKIRSSVNIYLSCVFAYRTMKGRPRIHIQFENLVKDPAFFVNSLIEKMKIDKKLSDFEVEKVLSLSKDSLDRKGHRPQNPVLREKLLELTSKYISYDQVFELLRD
nr:sulfotransferase domain-containing protein [uncultured Cohaesibacter sp.]